MTLYRARFKLQPHCLNIEYLRPYLTLGLEYRSLEVLDQAVLKACLEHLQRVIFST